MCDMDWLWHAVGAIILLGAAGLGATALVSEHKIDGYYLSRGETVSTTTCVYSHWTWHPDEQTFCTNNYSEAADFVEKANASFKH